MPALLDSALTPNRAPARPRSRDRGNGKGYERGRMDEMKTFTEINDSTGFANGDKFASADEVRAYFTVENMESMFGCVECTVDGLNEMADQVIAHGWHCDF